MNKIPFPREHGTWAMLYVPILIAFASAPLIKVDVLVLIFAMTSMFFLRNPLVTRIRLSTKANSNSLSWIILYSTVALSCGGYLLIRGFTFLLLFLVFFVFLLAVQLLMQSRKQDHGKLSELIAIAGLTSSGLITRGVLIGDIDKHGYLLWLLCFLFFSSSVFYVNMRVSRQTHKKDSKEITSLCVTFHMVLVLTLVTLVFYGVIPVYIAVAYFPIVIRAFLGIAISGKINLRRIGFGEIVYTIIFVSVLIFTENNVL